MIHPNTCQARNPNIVSRMDEFWRPLRRPSGSRMALCSSWSLRYSAVLSPCLSSANTCRGPRRNTPNESQATPSRSVHGARVSKGMRAHQFERLASQLGASPDHELESRHLGLARVARHVLLKVELACHKAGGKSSRPGRTEIAAKEEKNRGCR